MRLTWRDAVATVLVAAIMVPYVGYLFTGSMPFIQGVTGMAGVGLALGAVAAVVGGWIATREGILINNATLALAIVSAGFGITALVSENMLDPAGRQIALGIFMATIVGLWGLALLRHSGIIPAVEEQGTSRLGDV